MPESYEVKKSQLVLRGRAIREDADGLLCLDDIWVLTKSGQTKTPVRWMAMPNAKRLVKALKQRVARYALVAGDQINPVFYIKEEQSPPELFAHPILATAYAGFLSEKLEIEVREVWLRYRAGDAKLADEILQRASAEDNRWAGVRAMGRVKRAGFTDTLKNHGVTGRGYPQCTDAVYKEVLNGTAREMRIEMGLPKKANLRDHMDADMLSFVMTAEVLATGRIDEQDCRGNDECAEASARSASFIREAIERDKEDRKVRKAS